MSLILLISIIALVILLCIPATKAPLVVFFIDYFPSAITIILVLTAVVILLVLSGVAAGAALLWWIYGPVLLVIAMLAIFAKRSPLARWWLWRVLVIGLFLSLLPLYYQQINTWLHVQFPALTEWQLTSQELANIKLQESSLSMKSAIRDSEVTIGTFGRIKEDGIAYDDFGAEIRGLIRKNQPVKSMGKIKSQEKNGNEGLIQVMLPRHGNFVGGDVVWVPIRNVTWEKQVMEKEDKDTPPPPAPTQQPPVSTPNSQRLNGQIVGANLCIDGNQYTGKLTLTGDLFAFNGRDQNGNTLSLAGSRDKDCIWTGSWNKNKETPKSFLLRFTRKNNFSGEVYKYTEDGKEMKFDVKAITSTITSAR